MWVAIASIVILLLLAGALIREVQLSRRLERQLDALHAQQMDTLRSMQLRLEKLRCSVESLDVDGAQIDAGLPRPTSVRN